MDDRQAMARAIELARISAEHGSHPFGCVITLNGALLAESENTVVPGLDPTGHAEIAAIRKACLASRSLMLAGATLYTSCEPCWMCSTAIRRTGISRVVIALSSVSGGGGFTSEYPILTTAAFSGLPPEVVSGFMTAESQAVWTAVGWPPAAR
jgi:guanine deaminase